MATKACLLRLVSLPLSPATPTSIFRRGVARLHTASLPNDPANSRGVYARSS